MSWEITAICVGCGVRGETIFTDTYSGGTVIPKTWTTLASTTMSTAPTICARCGRMDRRRSDEVNMPGNRDRDPSTTGLNLN